MMIWTAGIDLEVNEQQDMTSYVVLYKKKIKKNKKTYNPLIF